MSTWWRFRSVFSKNRTRVAIGTEAELRMHMQRLDVGSGCGSGVVWWVTCARCPHALYSRFERLVALCDAWQREASGTLALLGERPDPLLEVTNVFGGAVLVLAEAQGGGGGAA